MKKKPALAAAVTTAFVLLFLAGPDSIRANDSAPALTGQVSSQKEGPMEGVVIGAKQEGSTITVNVTSDNKGRFSFPASKLPPGRYALKVRAGGYDLADPKLVEIVAGKAATADLKLVPAKDLSSQLSDAEWLLSIPGTEQQKNFLLGCNGCHTIERIVKTNHSADEWVHPLAGRSRSTDVSHEKNFLLSPFVLLAQSVIFR